MIPPYPLAWPELQKSSDKRVKSQFRTTLGGAIGNDMVRTTFRGRVTALPAPGAKPAGPVDEINALREVCEGQIGRGN